MKVNAGYKTKTCGEINSAQLELMPTCKQNIHPGEETNPERLANWWSDLQMSACKF
jgi:hypothetical protein